MAERVFVGNLNYNVTESELRSAFEENGFRVSECVIVTDRETGQARGFGFVTFADEGAAKRSIQLMDGTLVARRPLRVSEAHERERRGPGAGPNRGPSRGAPPVQAAPPQEFRRQRDGGRRRRDRDEEGDRW